jgi:transcriptional regulator with XRE-family HTH domain
VRPEEAFGQVMRGLRLERGLTQQELADAARVHRNHIGLLERGARAPTLPMLFDLALALGVSPAHVVGRVEELVGPALEPRQEPRPRRGSWR